MMEIMELFEVDEAGLERLEQISFVQIDDGNGPGLRRAGHRGGGRWAVAEGLCRRQGRGGGGAAALESEGHGGAEAVQLLVERPGVLVLGNHLQQRQLNLRDDGVRSIVRPRGAALGAVGLGALQHVDLGLSGRQLALERGDLAVQVVQVRSRNRRRGWERRRGGWSGSKDHWSRGGDRRGGRRSRRSRRGGRRRERRRGGGRGGNGGVSVLGTDARTPLLETRIEGGGTGGG